MVVSVVSRIVRHGILRERTLGDVHSHAAQIQRRVGSARLHPGTAAPAVAAGHFAASTAVSDQFLVQFIVQRTAVLVAVQSVVQSGWIQVVVGILEGEQTVFWKIQREP